MRVFKEIVSINASFPRKLSFHPVPVQKLDSRQLKESCSVSHTERTLNAKMAEHQLFAKYTAPTARSIGTLRVGSKTGAEAAQAMYRVGRDDRAVTLSDPPKTYIL